MGLRTSKYRITIFVSAKDYNKCEIMYFESRVRQGYNDYDKRTVSPLPRDAAVPIIMNISICYFYASEYAQ
ncbi:unnamed protein product [Clonostachys rhizophaga]|uniref:Uncharacterized protein n=1 Tax=Clonostachys rhizophaga TaxID=160324 RepID=A0A9N9VFB3_9HYPO|nr:unnamed protein product [Clonostachys rhizophaga]